MNLVNREPHHRESLVAAVRQEQHARLVGLIPLLTFMKTMTMPSQNARHYNEVHPDDGKGQYMSAYGRKNLTNHLARMSTFQRLKHHQRSKFSSGVHEDE